MKSIHVEPRHHKIISEIVKEFGFETFVYGSRATGKHRPYSDLDLCIKGSPDKRTLRQFQDALEESDLPYKVDVVLWTEISDEFKQKIEKDLIKFEVV